MGECEYFACEISHRSNLWLFEKTKGICGILMKICKNIQLTDVILFAFICFELTWLVMLRVQ